MIHSLLEHEVPLARKSCLMQPFRKERQNKPYRCAHCPKSFKSSNGLKYHSEKVHVDEEVKMDVCSGNEVEGKTRDMPPKQRSIPPALELSPDVNLLTEFALIATSPQSPLVREVNGENVDARCSEGESPPPQLVDPKQMDFQSGQWRSISHSSSVSPTRTSMQQTLPAVKWHFFMTGARIKFPDENGQTWRTVDDIDMEEVSKEMFQDGLRVVDFERINTRYDENSDEFVVAFKSCGNEQRSLKAEISADHPFFVKGSAQWASLNPAATELHYGLSCQPLQRGDVCLLPYDPDVVACFNGTQWDGEENSSEFTADMSIAAHTLSSMAKDKEEHSHRRSKLLSHSPPSRLKRNGAHQFSKRPMNAFMLFAQKFRLEITQAHPGKDNRAISVILGDKWKAMKQEDRREYVIQAKILADEHKRVNPDCWKRKRNSEGSSKISFRRP